MAEIILPPEENEETPQVPELNIDKPTENSKVITIEFEAKKTNKVSTKDTNQQLYTTDTDAWFEFKETSLEGANGTYSVVFINRHDGSIFQRTGDVVNGVAYYKIPHQEIRHAGAWRGQIVYTLSNGDTTAREFGYDVKGHILDGKDVREIVVEDFETLMAQLRSIKDNAELELANLVNTAEQNETDRQAFFDDLVEDIDDLQANYQELLDTGVLQTNINTKLEQLEEEYAPKLTEVTAQLAQTIKLDDSNLTLNNFTEEDRAVIQGLEPGEINAVLGESNVLTENIGAEQVTPRKLKGYQTNNLLDFDNAIKDTYVNYNGEPTPFEPVFRSSDTLVVSNKIYGVAGENYTVSHIGDTTFYAVFFFNENDMITSYITKPHSDLNSHHSFEFPEGSSYFLTNIRVSTIPLEQHFIAKTSELENTDKFKYKWLLVDDDNIQKGSIKHESLNGSIKPNLLEPENSLVGKYQRGTSESDFLIASSSSITLSNFIPCKTGDTFTISLSDMGASVYLYNDNQEPIEAINTGIGKYNYTFTIDNSDAEYFRVNMRTSLVPLNEFMIAKGTTLENAGKKKLDWLEITNDNLSKDFVFHNPWESTPTKNWYSHKEGKTLVTFGNSRTWYDGKTYSSSSKEPNQSVKGYQSYIREQLGMEVINVGVSGARIHQTVQTLKDYNFTGDEYAISLMHGTNNFNAIEGGESGYTFGEVDHTKSGNYDVMSYAGGLQEFVEYVATELPWLKLYLMPDAWCYFSTHGGMPREYADVVREVAELYHYPFEDVYHKCGFNEHNMDLYFVDGGSHQFHESTKGFERTSEIIVPFIANN